MTYQMLLLYTAPDNFTAEMLMAALRENNIPAVKRDLGAAGLLNLYQGNSFEGEQIYVAPEAFERAKERRQRSRATRKRGFLPPAGG